MSRLSEKKELKYKKVRFFFSQLNWKEILTFCFFLFLSATFWLILILRQTFEATIQIPIKYVEIPDSIFLKNPLPNKMSVGISDKGLALFHSFFSNKGDSIEINVRNCINARNTVIKEDQLVQLLKTKFNKTTNLLRYYPSRINLEYSLLKSKKVPVIFDGEVTTKQNFLLSGDITVTPDSVIAYSSEEILKTLNVAFTTSNQVNDLNKNTVIKLHLRNEKKIRFSPDIVDVSIPVAEFTQKEVTVPVKCLNQPFGMNVIFFPSNVTISFAVALSNFKNISPQDFSINLDYNELQETTNGIIRLRLTDSPSYIQNIAIQPASVEFILEKTKAY
ncbi:MAG: hypothetical protein QM654_13035 [Dysgonamonadaceae bacterium]